MTTTGSRPSDRSEPSTQPNPSTRSFETSCAGARARSMASIESMTDFAGGRCGRDMSRIARLYGILTGTAGEHRDARVERELRHLRAMGIFIHRPLTLRLLNDASERRTGSDQRRAGGNWDMDTRLRLADRATAGMNEAGAELAHGLGPSASKRWRALRGAPEKRSRRTCIRPRATLPEPRPGRSPCVPYRAMTSMCCTRMNETIRRPRGVAGRWASDVTSRSKSRSTGPAGPTRFGDLSNST